MTPPSPVATQTARLVATMLDGVPPTSIRVTAARRRSGASSRVRLTRRPGGWLNRHREQRRRGSHAKCLRDHDSLAPDPYDSSSIRPTCIRLPAAVERSPPTTSPPAGSRISERDTAVNDWRSDATVTVAFTFVVPR